jgi:hypothetical protein
MWDQQVVVENRVGAGGTIAGAAVANAPSDGYTLFHCNIASSAIAAAMYPKLPYDPLRDFAMVSRIATTANALIVHPSLPARSVAEFIGYAKSYPGKLSYGSPGVGTSPHLSMELFKTVTGINVVHVAARRHAELADLMGGQIPVMLANLPGAAAAHRLGKNTRARRDLSKTHAAAAIGPDHDRVGRGRLRCHCVVRHVRARRHARTDSGKAPHRSYADSAGTGCAAAPERSGHRGRADEP